MKKATRSARLLAVALTLGLLPPAVAAEAHQATGFKVVNVTSAAADIWTRVTLRPAANPDDGPLPRVEAFEVKTGKPVALRENRVFPDTRITVHMPTGLDLGAAAGGRPPPRARPGCAFASKGRPRGPRLHGSMREWKAMASSCIPWRRSSRLPIMISWCRHAGMRLTASRMSRRANSRARRGRTNASR